jgi:hypothetical protein
MVVQPPTKLVVLICAWLSDLLLAVYPVPFQLSVPALRVLSCMKMVRHVVHCLHVDQITSHALLLLDLTKTAYQVFGDVMDRMIVLMLVMKLAAPIASHMNSVVKLGSV